MGATLKTTGLKLLIYLLRAETGLTDLMTGKYMYVMQMKTLLSS